ncbi:unnamed protein product [Brassica oleracea]
MRKTFEPSPGIYDPLAHVDPVKTNKLMQHIRPLEKITFEKAHEDIEFYMILITERPWPMKEYGWLFQNHVAAFIRVLIARSKLDPSPLWSKRIAFIDFWYFGVLVHDYNQFMLKPK